MIEPRYTELLNPVNEEILQLQEQLRQQGVKHHGGWHCINRRCGAN